MTNEPNRELFVPKTGAIRHSTLAEAAVLPASFSKRTVSTDWPTAMVSQAADRRST